VGFLSFLLKNSYMLLFNGQHHVKYAACDAVVYGAADIQLLKYNQLLIILSNAAVLYCGNQYCFIKELFQL
jgi:hypothetical protein